MNGDEEEEEEGKKEGVRSHEISIILITRAHLIQERRPIHQDRRCFFLFSLFFFQLSTEWYISRRVSSTFVGWDQWCDAYIKSRRLWLPEERDRIDQ